MPAEFPTGSEWSDEDVEKMLRLIEGGSSLHELARALERSEAELERQACFLGVLLPHGAMPVSTPTADSSAASSTIHYAPFAQTPRRSAA